LDEIVIFLPVIGLLLGGVSFYLFYKLMFKSYPSEGERYVKEMKSKTNVLVTLFLFGIFFFVDDFNYRVIIAVLIIIDLIVRSALQHKKLKELSFDPDFIRGLRYSEYFAGLSTCLLICFFIV
tara:strand:- start:1224 stop:1592 length:369 start_codon:yes stop_codon:yes gene_type:complete